MARRGREGILWCDETWNPVRGCSHVSAGCDNCWAARIATRHENNPLTPHLRGFARGGHWTGKVALIDSELEKPLHWRKPKRIAVGLMGDLFRLPDADIDRVFAVMALCPQHTFLLLTKQAKRMYEYITSAETRLRALYAHDMAVARMAPVKKVAAVKRIRALSFEDSILPMPWPLTNVHPGVSAEDQATLDERVPWLLKTPAAHWWLSLEPLLGSVDIERYVDCIGQEFCQNCGDDERPLLKHCEMEWTPGGDAVCSKCGGPRSATGYNPVTNEFERLDHVVVGGESGPGARPLHPQWVRDVRDQCSAAGVPFTFKQWGAWAPAEPGRNSVLTPGSVRPNSLGPDRVHWFYPDGQHTSVDKCADIPKPEVLTMRVGKHAAGRMLDGREWNEDLIPSGSEAR